MFDGTQMTLIVKIKYDFTLYLNIIKLIMLQYVLSAFII